MQWFVQPDSIVRHIWGDADLVMLIFGAGAAEFALNRAVDWLFFTGAIPNDPLGRLFSTAAYAQGIVFAEQHQAERILARIHAIHGAVEQQRGGRIPDWAHRDVLYMLIDYTERVFHTLYRPLLPAEQEEIFDTFRRVGVALEIPDLPTDYNSWKRDRQVHLEKDLVLSSHTVALCTAYRRDLGFWRYTLLRQIQAVLVSKHVHKLLNLPRFTWLRPTTLIYPTLIRLGFGSLIHHVLIPARYVAAVQRLYTPSSTLYSLHN
jgi:hypothetical protein